MLRRAKKKVNELVKHPFPNRPVSWLHLNQEQRTDLKENRKETPLVIFHPHYLERYGKLSGRKKTLFLDTLASAAKDRPVFLFTDPFDIDRLSSEPDLKHFSDKLIDKARGVILVPAQHLFATPYLSPRSQHDSDNGYS
ncbi:hypothetical protein AUJ65_06010 [Candidatus Micrarchaeota archaeon CG1_02_51_15]|nr:MAG: hypothetical protein AUJ65_06010 [Candidatus Micrarchaeota archaeon CG1_02_51_15]